MEVPSDEEAAGRDIPPIQINAIHAASSFGGAHGHMIHHHNLHHHHHDPSAAAAAVALGPQNQIQSSTTTTTNGSSHQPNRISLQLLHLDPDEDDEDQVNNNINIKAGGIPKTKKSSSSTSSVGGLVIIKYKECLKNHAAAMGGTATDGCCEFMPSGEEGTIEALNCSACKCHRNFHRKQIEGAHHSSSNWDHDHHTISRFGSSSRNKFLLAAAPGPTSDHDQHHHRTMAPPFSRNYLHHHNQMLMMPNYNNSNIGMGMGMGMHVGSIPSESDHHEQLEEYHDDDHGGRAGSRPSAAMHVNKQKRFRTKFSEEQKQKMLRFAEKAGWKIQKQEESVVQQLCQEIGVKRRVLKVWMHNNKHNHLPKNNIPPPPPPPPPPA